MLIACLFRIAIIIAAYFNLKIKQDDVINAFINAIYNIEGSLVIYQLFLSYKKLGFIAEVNQALYSLCDSPAL